MEMIDSDFSLQGDHGIANRPMLPQNPFFFSTFAIFDGFCPLKNHLGGKTIVPGPVYMPKFNRHRFKGSFVQDFVVLTLGFPLMAEWITHGHR